MHYSGDNSYLFVNGKEIYKLKGDNGILNLKFVYEAYLMDLMLLTLEKYLQENVYDFSADYKAVDKFEILNIDKYLIVENNIK